MESARNFANKVWNASRFVLMNVDTRRPVDLNQLTLADQWILTRFQDAVRDITAHNEEGDFGLSATRIYDFAWSEFCDWYIELAKSRLTGEDEAAKHSVQAVLLYVLEDAAEAAASLHALPHRTGVQVSPRHGRLPDASALAGMQAGV